MVDRRMIILAGALVALPVVGVGGWVAMNRQVTPLPAKSPKPAASEPRPAPPAGSEQVVVKYARDVSDERIAAFEAEHGLKRVNELPKIKAKVYAVPAGATTDEVIGWFTSEEGLVAYAERNGTMQAIP